MAATSTEKRRPDSSTFGSSSAIVVDPSTKCESSSEISRTNGCLSVKVDGCWAWVVSLAAFLIMMFVDGISFTYGIISKEFSRYFHLEDNVAKGTLPGAVLLGFYMMAGPVGSVLVIRLGYRTVAVIGSVLAIVGFISASFAPNFELLTLTYGAIAGLGFSFLYLTSMVATTVYFSRWRALAVGLASCGSGIGIIVYPLLASHVIDVLNWQWCLRIQAGIIFLCLLLSLIFRPLTSEVNVEKPTMREALKASFKLSLLKSPFFILFMIIACVSTIAVVIPFNYIPLASLERNLTESQSAWLVSIMGATNTAGRVLAGAAAFRAPFHPIVFLIAGYGMGTVSTFLSVLCYSFTTLAIYCGFFGLVFAIDAALNTVILAKTLGEENLSGSFGSLCLIRGISGMTVTAVAGLLYDITGNYRATFYLSASTSMLTAIFSSVLLILAKTYESRSSYNLPHSEPACYDHEVDCCEERGRAMVSNIGMTKLR